MSIGLPVLGEQFVRFQEIESPLVERVYLEASDGCTDKHRNCSREQASLRGLGRYASEEEGWKCEGRTNIRISWASALRLSTLSNVSFSLFRYVRNASLEPSMELCLLSPGT